jgi:hypothetical protein
MELKLLGTFRGYNRPLQRRRAQRQLAASIMRQLIFLQMPRLSARIGVLRQYQQFLNETHRKAEARQVVDEIARLSRAQTPACRNCTVNGEGLRNALR